METGDEMQNEVKNEVQKEMQKNKKDIAVCIVFGLLLFGGFLLCVFLPKPRYLESERRFPASEPVFSAASLWSGRYMADFEGYVSDGFPFREGFRRMKALTARNVFFRQDDQGIYMSDGYICAMEYPLREESLDHALERFAYICEKYPIDKKRVFLSVIPDKNCFLAGESGHLSMDYEEFERRMMEKGDFAEYIRISDLLELEDYYRTDSHWRQERITDVAERLARAMGTTLPGEYETHTLEGDFYGVYYGQAALPAKPDKIRYLTGEDMEGCRVYDWENGRTIPVYNMECAAGRDPYEMFLSGPLSLITIENPKGKKDKKLIIFRDSFGSGIAPLLIGGYQQITLVDIRYIHPDHLGQFIDFEGSDVLFLYSTLVLNNSDTIK